MDPLCLFDEELKLGIRDLYPAAVLADGEAPDAALEVSCETWSPEADVVCARATVTNGGEAAVRIKGIRWSFDAGGRAQAPLHVPLALDPHVFANEHYRSDFLGIGTTEGDRFAYPLTNQYLEFGNGEDHVFPGIFVASAVKPVGLLVALASQRRFLAQFRSRGKVMGKEQYLFEIEERATGGSGVEVPAGGSLEGETVLLHLAKTADPQQATGPYFRVLREEGAFARRERNPLPGQRIYCSWNYDFFAEIDQEKLLAQVPIIKEHLPQVGFVQLDDGYQTCHGPKQRAMIDLCYGDLEHPFNTETFPDGPKALADAVKAGGLRPAIWLGLWASSGSQMIQDHPEWVLCDDTGRPLHFSRTYGGTTFLDPSVPGVQDYLDRMCATVFGEWGFEGVKLDFSSLAFNAKRVRYRDPDVTSVEMRHKLESIFRKHLPEDGFFGWCVVAGTAQPFLSQADYFRNAIDINKGDWTTVKRVAWWTANTNLFLQERPCLPNMDSIGWSEEFDETTWETWLNLAAVAGGALEVSGDLRKLDAGQLAYLAKTLELSDPSRRVRCLDITADRPMDLPPALWLAEGGDGERLLGVFNWADEAREMSLDVQALDGVQGTVSNPWDDREVYSDGLPGAVKLAAHASTLLRWQG